MNTDRPYSDETYMTVDRADFANVCGELHKRLESPVMIFFAEDLRKTSGIFALYCGFLNARERSWVFVRQDIAKDDARFTSLAKEIYSASLFEREIAEMFGIIPEGHPDLRSMKLHDEVWLKGYYPLRKDFEAPQGRRGTAKYQFKKVAGEGIFEVPVGPVHAGIIGPGHFRFSAAGEPIINLEIRLGWTHRGIEKLLEGKAATGAMKLFECISGDTAFGYGLAFCRSVEKISGITAPARAEIIRVLCLELERLYNHANDMGGMALDVGFSFAAQFASLIKEDILRLNEALTGSRYLKGMNTPGGVTRDIDEAGRALISKAMLKAGKDLSSLEELLFSSISFMDRVDTAGILRTKTARDLGITGLAARASSIPLDTRKIFPGIYESYKFDIAVEHSGDATARLKVRCKEAKESISLITQSLDKLNGFRSPINVALLNKEGFALGCAEGWRGPILVWTRLDKDGLIERCKIADPSFHNWDGLSFAALGNIIPDFPLCNKSFDLSYPGNDL